MTGFFQIWSFSHEIPLLLICVYIIHKCIINNLGGADRIIRLWELNSELCVQEYRGHADVVRDVKVISADMFLSVSNDWYVDLLNYYCSAIPSVIFTALSSVRKWNIHTGQCLRDIYGHEAFVYR